MKKYAIALFFVLLGNGTLIAQNLPDKGSFSAEVRVNPFDDYGKTSVLDGIKFRYFLHQKHALRLDVNWGTNKEEYSFEESLEKGTQKSSFTARETYFTLNAGYEYHMIQGNRFDFYAGGEAGWVRHFAETTGEVMHNGKSHSVGVSNAFVEQDKMSSIGGIDLRSLSSEQQAKAGFRVAALVGADCYLYKGFYVGAEVGFSVSSLKIKKMENTFVNLVTDEIMTQWDTMEQRENKCYFSVEPNIRLGWTF